MKTASAIAILSLWSLTGCLEEEIPEPGLIPQSEIRAGGYFREEGDIKEYRDSAEEGRCADKICLNTVVQTPDKQRGVVTHLSQDGKELTVEIAHGQKKTAINIKTSEVAKEVLCFNSWCENFNAIRSGANVKILDVYSNGLALVSVTGMGSTIVVATSEFVERTLPSTIKILSAFYHSINVTLSAVRECSATYEDTPNGISCSITPSSTLPADPAPGNYKKFEARYLCGTREMTTAVEPVVTGATNRLYCPK
jgi:hypothetical protein